jgi:hypothetical protein
MVKLGRKQYLGWGLEATAGTAVTIANGDYHLVEDVSVEMTGDENERVGNLGSIDGMAGVTGSRMGTISFTTELRGGGVTGTAPVDIPLWKASGFECGETNYTATSNMVVDQTVPTTSDSSVTLKYYADGTVWQFKGCSGNVVVTMESGMVGKCAWTFQGQVNQEVQDASNPTPSYNTVVPPVCQNTTLTLDSGTDFGVCKSITFDMGNEITDRRDMSEERGYAIPRITRRLGTGTMTVEIPALSSYDWNSKWRNKTKIDGSILVGTETFKKMTFAWDMVCTSAPNPTDADGIMTYEVSFALVTDNLAGNNTFNLTYT